MVNQIDQFGNCLSLGRADGTVVLVGACIQLESEQCTVGMFNVNPYADGAFAAVYNGDWIDHVQGMLDWTVVQVLLKCIDSVVPAAYSSHVYFVCDTTQCVVDFPRCVSALCFLYLQEHERSAV
jgi:hypothetical protein